MAKQALLTYGGWRGHTPYESMKMMEEILIAEGFEVDFVPEHGTEDAIKKLQAYGMEVSETIDPLRHRDYLEDLDLIVFCHTMSKITGEEEANLTNAVMDGCGLVGWHGGLCDAFRSNVGYNFLTGATWVSHPGGAGTTYEVNFVPEKKGTSL